MNKVIPGYVIYFSTLLTFVLIIIASLIPHPPEIMQAFSFSDKIFHAFAYSALSFLLLLSLKTGFSGKYRYSLVTVVLIMLFGGLIEVIQPYFSRSRDIFDFIADILGGAAGIITAENLIRILKMSFSKKGVSFGRKHL